jgi:hypothetical protein
MFTPARGSDKSEGEAVPASRSSPPPQRKQPLKVFRTAVGFDDAYVAAPSRKAALAAWGASKDLFAIGSAELVTDPDLTAAPLAEPGKVIRRSRGDLAAQLAATAAAPRKAARSEAPVKGAAPAPRKTRPKPPPSRNRVDAAEAALAAFEARAKSEIAALRRREDALRREREALERDHSRKAGELSARLAQAREHYERAMARWRG